MYAPHNARPLDERFDFYAQLDVEYRNYSANVGKFIFGDLNARLGRQQPGEEDIIGDSTFGKPALAQVEVPNRSLLVEFCIGNSLLVANTFTNAPMERRATFAEPGQDRTSDINEEGFTMLDLVLCDCIFRAR